VLRGGVDCCTYPLLTHETLLSALLIPLENVVARYDVRASLHSEAIASQQAKNRLPTLGGGFSRVVGLEHHPVPANCHVLGIANTLRTIHGAHDHALVDHQNDQALCHPDQEHPWRVLSRAHSGHLYL
jgi:hypothetical protein